MCIRTGILRDTTKRFMSGRFLFSCECEQVVRYEVFGTKTMFMFTLCDAVTASLLVTGWSGLQRFNLFNLLQWFNLQPQFLQFGKRKF